MFACFDVFQPAISQPIPPTPSLNHSPSSTKSSAGDCTIRMSTFTDDTMPPFSHHILVISGGNEVPLALKSPGAS
ncbi:hypothetical protein R3P38DRAFT_3172391 [Favolaschia claudopus]|uniref:Uncharacterized protein n=1 Tax=Favolaschia claudopus TaxID=2862362 RepID=A0AAW0DLB5_9AGAR